MTQALGFGGGAMLRPISMNRLTLVAVLLLTPAACGGATAPAASEDGQDAQAVGASGDAAADSAGDARQPIDPATYCVEPDWSAAYCQTVDGTCLMPDGTVWRSLERGGYVHYIVADSGDWQVLCDTAD